MEEGAEIVSFGILVDGRTCLQWHALSVERGKTFAKTFKSLNSASTEESSCGTFITTVPKTVKKVVIQVQKEPTPTSVQISVAADLPVVPTCVRFGFFVMFVVTVTAQAMIPRPVTTPFL